MTDEPLPGASPSPESGARASSHTHEPGAYRLGRRYSLGRNKQYQYVYRRGKSFPGRRLTLVYLRGRGLKVGFSASSKLGCAVVRNRVRRRMKEDFRMLRSSLLPGRYIFVARAAAVDAPWRAMGDEMRAILRRAQLIREDETT